MKRLTGLLALTLLFLGACKDDGTSNSSSPPDVTPPKVQFEGLAGALDGNQLVLTVKAIDPESGIDSLRVRILENTWFERDGQIDIVMSTEYLRTMNRDTTHLWYPVYDTTKGTVVWKDSISGITERSLNKIPIHVNAYNGAGHQAAVDTFKTMTIDTSTSSRPVIADVRVGHLIAGVFTPGVNVPVEVQDPMTIQMDASDNHYVDRMEIWQVYSPDTVFSGADTLLKDKRVMLGVVTESASKDDSLQTFSWTWNSRGDVRSNAAKKVDPVRVNGVVDTLIVIARDRLGWFRESAPIHVRLKDTEAPTGTIQYQTVIQNADVWLDLSTNAAKPDSFWHTTHAFRVVGYDNEGVKEASLFFKFQKTRDSSGHILKYDTTITYTDSLLTPGGENVAFRELTTGSDPATVKDVISVGSVSVWASLTDQFGNVSNNVGKTTIINAQSPQLYFTPPKVIDSLDFRVIIKRFPFGSEIDPTSLMSVVNRDTLLNLGGNDALVEKGVTYTGTLRQDNGSPYIGIYWNNTLKQGVLRWVVAREKSGSLVNVKNDFPFRDSTARFAVSARDLYGRTQQNGFSRNLETDLQTKVTLSIVSPTSKDSIIGRTSVVVKHVESFSKSPRLASMKSGKVYFQYEPADKTEPNPSTGEADINPKFSSATITLDQYQGFKLNRKVKFWAETTDNSPNPNKGASDTVEVMVVDKSPATLTWKTLEVDGDKLHIQVRANENRNIEFDELTVQAFWQVNDSVTQSLGVFPETIDPFEKTYELYGDMALLFNRRGALDIFVEVQDAAKNPKRVTQTKTLLWDDPPEITVQSAYISSDSLFVVGMASDDVALKKVEFYVDNGDPVYTVSSGFTSSGRMYAMTAGKAQFATTTLSEGNHLLFIVVTDQNNQIAYSGYINVTKSK